MDDILYQIFLYLDVHTILNCMLVDSQWNTISKHGGIWKKFCSKQYPEFYIEVARETWYETYKHCCRLSNARIRLGADDAYHQYNQRILNLRKKHLPNVMDVICDYGIPDEILFYHNLHVLSLSGFEIIPKEIFYLANLRNLDLSGNNLTIVPNEISLLTDLINFNGSNNMLTIIPTGISSLAKLCHIDLSRNKITSITGIGGLVNLRTLYINHNSLVTITDEISKLTNLEYLHLRNNSLRSIPKEIAYLTALKSLNLPNNKIQSIPIETGRLVNLRWMNLAHNLLESIPAESIPAEMCTKTDLLAGLHLEHNPLNKDEFPYELRKIDGLTIYK